VWQVSRNVLVRDLADHAPVNYVPGVFAAPSDRQAYSAVIRRLCTPWAFAVVAFEPESCSSLAARDVSRLVGCLWQD
jgi:hypothetical protein